MRINMCFVTALLVVVMTYPGWVGAIDFNTIDRNSSTRIIEFGDSNILLQSDILDVIERDGSAGFFIVLREQADVSGAYLLSSKFEKGRFVYRTLSETAAWTQTEIISLLVQEGITYESFWIQNMILVQGDYGVLSLLESRDDIMELRLNHKVQALDPKENEHAYAAPSSRAIEWNLIQINADDVWDQLGVTGEGIVVMDADTGVDWDHPALKNQYRGWNGSSADHNYNWYDATGTYPNAPGDGYGHGTHTTGTMVGYDGGNNQIGVAPGAKWIGFKNMTNSGSGEDVYFHKAFQWSIAPTDLNDSNPDPDKAPHVMNNSWGYWGGNQPQFETDITNCVAAGIVIEVSSGNEGSSCSSLRSPGDYQISFTTGATVSGGNIWSSSSRGPSDLYPSIMKPDVVAPGANIRSCVPGGGYEGGWSGTSMAGPHTCGIVALLLSANSALIGDVALTRDIIEQSADSTATTVCTSGGGVPNNVYGWGEIDCYAAVEPQMGTPTPTPSAPTYTPTVTPTPTATPCIWAGFDPMEGYSETISYADTTYYFDDGTGLGSVNETGILTGWSVNCASAGSMGLRIIRPLGGSSYQYIGGSNVVNVSSGINDFPDTIYVQVEIGDLLGVYFPASGIGGVGMNGNSDNLWYFEGDVATAGTFDTAGNSSHDGYPLIRIYGFCGNTPTPPPTNTPVNSYTPTPSPSPTIPECNSLGIDIVMPAEEFKTGDECYMDLIICNPNHETYSDIPIFALLDVYGNYFFAPSFTEIDFYVWDVPPGNSIIHVLPVFDWPTGAGTAEGIKWYAAMTTADMSEIMGDYSMFMFGWSE